MTRRRFLSFTGAAGAAFIAAGGLRPSRASACPNLDLPDQNELLAKGISQFAADLHARLARDEKGSMFFSPFSIETALAMTAAGARGETLTEMEKTLHLQSEPHAAFGDLIDRLNWTGAYAKRDRRPYEPPSPTRSGRRRTTRGTRSFWNSPASTTGLAWSKRTSPSLRPHERRSTTGSRNRRRRRSRN